MKRPKYKIKTYVNYYRDVTTDCSGNKERTNEQSGYINGIEYRCESSGDIKMKYIISDRLGSSFGYSVPEEAIICEVSKCQN